MSRRDVIAATTPISGLVGFLGSTERRGPWQLPRHLRAVAVLGNVEIDLRQAIIGFGVSDIEVVAVLGNVEIIVPPEVAVDCDGDGLLGTFNLEFAGRVNTSLADRERVVRVTGSAYAASVTVRVKGPDESMMAKLRRNMGLTSGND
ncbi:MAG TPA: LiaF domain-containing protein [Gemmatimonadaceae bacterium]|nr:LiaF domain-containing protein [Gemmatimonadaceae bacterium]